MARGWTLSVCVWTGGGEGAGVGVGRAGGAVSGPGVRAVPKIL